jgi:uroporphyrin-III C-methyltransferase
MSGRVYLVGAGPGDPELLTLKALRLLRAADVVLHDDLVTPEILQFVPPTVLVVNVGKRCGQKTICQREINALMVEHALAGFAVVRLKGGDPMIFGRAGEEIAVLRSAGIQFEVVPGVTAVLGAAAAAQMTLTQRHVAPAITLVTYGRATAEPATNWRAMVESGATLALYMPGEDYRQISHELREAGLDRETPCLLISRATTAAEQVHVTSLERLEELKPMPTPTLMVIGSVVGRAARPMPGLTQPVNGAGPPAVLVSGGASS